MSSFATMYGFARKFGLRYFVTVEQYEQLTYYFEPETLALSVLERDLPHYYTSLLGTKWSRLPWETPWEKINEIDNNFKYDNVRDEKLHTGKAINIGDFPNEVQHFAEYLPDLRRRFTLKERFRKRAEESLQSELLHRGVGQSDVTWVGVHNRRGDYRDHLASLYGLQLLEADYFHRAMRRFNSEYTNVIFIIVTDDMEWAETNLMFPGLQVAFAGHSKVLQKDIHHPLAAADDIGDDLALLAACNHTILSYGTFGQWGALLAGGKVVISDTAAMTKEGRELIEGGLGAHNSGWTWIPASLEVSLATNLATCLGRILLASTATNILIQFR